MSAHMQHGANIPSLDGIRALAVGLVFFAHTAKGSWLPGGLGVTIFFVLSGYLITTLMRMEHAKNGSLDLRMFYLRRVLRLMPPLFVIVVLFGSLAALGVVSHGFTFAGLMSALFYFANYFAAANNFEGLPTGFGVMWSLAVEEHYYLFYPPLAALLLRIGRIGTSAGVLLGLCVAVLGWRYLLHANGAGENYLTMATDARIDSILFGCLMAMVRNPWLDAPARSSRALDWALIAVCAGVLMATLVYRDDVFRFTLRYTLQSIAIAPLIWLAVARADRWPFAWLNARPLVYIGTVSYTIYLSHHFIILALQQNLPDASWMLTASLAILFTAIVAELMRRYVEQPCAKLRKRLHRQPAAAGSRARSEHADRDPRQEMAVR